MASWFSTSPKKQSPPPSPKSDKASPGSPKASFGSSPSRMPAPDLWSRGLGTEMFHKGSGSRYDNARTGQPSVNDMTAETYVHGKGPPNLASKESAEMKNVTEG